MRMPNKYAIALTAALGLFPIAMDSTIVNVAIVPISKALSADVESIQWIFIGYLLANAAVVSLSGYLANRFGTKRLFLLGLAAFTGFSFLCGVAPSEAWLIALRVLQGMGGGLLLPLGAAVALDQFPTAERARAMATVAIPLLLAPVAGPILGGLIVDRWDWQAIFFVNVPVGLFGIALAARVLPEGEKATTEGPQRFDYPGLALSSLGVLALIYAFKLVSQTQPHSATALQPQGEIYGWGYWLVWALAAAGLALLATFALHSLRLRSEPVLDLRLFAHYDFTISNLVVWYGGMVGLGALFLIPVYLQQVHLPNLSALDTGVALLPLGLGTLFGMALGGGLFNKVGPRLVVVAGAVALGAGSWQLRNLSPATDIGALWPWLFLLGLGMTMTAVVAQTVALQPLRGAALNTGTSLVTAAKLLWGTVGSAVLVTIFAQQVRSQAARLRPQFLPGAAAGAAPDLHNPQTAAAYQHLLAQAGSNALGDVFTLLVYGSALLVLLALALPARGVRAGKKEQQQPTAAGVEHGVPVAR